MIILIPNQALANGKKHKKSQKNKPLLPLVLEVSLLSSDRCHVQNCTERTLETSKHPTSNQLHPLHPLHPLSLGISQPTLSDSFTRRHSTFSPQSARSFEPPQATSCGSCLPQLSSGLQLGQWANARFEHTKCLQWPAIAFP